MKLYGYFSTGHVVTISLRLSGPVGTVVCVPLENHQVNRSGIITFSIIEFQVPSGTTLVVTVTIDSVDSRIDDMERAVWMFYSEFAFLDDTYY